MKPPVVAVVAYQHFSPYHLSVPCLIFSDEILNGQKLFSLKVSAESSTPVRASYGASLAALHGLEVLQDADIVIIPGWHDPATPPSPELIAALRSGSRPKAPASWACVWEPTCWPTPDCSMATGRQRTGKLRATSRADSRKSVWMPMRSTWMTKGIVTSAGTAAGVDCCLYLVRSYYGSHITNQIARRMVVPSYREGGQAQFIERPVPVSTLDARINALLTYLRENLNEKLSLDALAQQAHMSRRTLTRSFHQATGMSVVGATGRTPAPDTGTP